jgi:hypothetical protein
MDFSYWYLLAVAAIIIACSAWGTVYNADSPAARQKMKFFASMCLESVVSVVAYWCLVFILALAIATALWLILMLLIWVPSDFFRNYVGLEAFSKALHNIRPYIYRSATSPGFTSIPLLDYVSLYSAFVFGPWFGVWSILSKYQKSKNLAPSTPDSA